MREAVAGFVKHCLDVAFSVVIEECVRSRVDKIDPILVKRADHIHRTFVRFDKIVWMGLKLTHVLFADTYNHKAAHGLRYIVNPPDAKVTVHQHLDIGQGEVDFETIFRKLREMKFDGIATNAVLLHAQLMPDLILLSFF